MRTSPRPRVRKTCICGKEFSVTPSDIARGFGKYCSRECRDIAQMNKIECTCQWCNETFWIVPSKIAIGCGKFCSKQCHNQSMMIQVDSICQICGKRFSTIPSRIEKGWGKCCSLECAGRIRSGENNPNFNGWASHKPYCEKWNEDLRDRVRTFFDYRCLACGMTTEENGNALSVHHIEYNKQTCCDESIPMFAALCNRHHGMSNWNKDRWQYMLSYIIQEVYRGRSYLPKEN
jgi:hypothetical protein